MVKNLETEVTDLLKVSGKDERLQPYLQFIFATYLKSLRYGNDWFKEIEPEVYFPTHEKILTHILGRPDTEVWLLVLKEDPDVIIGYSIHEGPVLHYLFIKGTIEARGLSLSRLLIPDNITTVSHLTKMGKVLFKKYGWKFNPYL